MHLTSSREGTIDTKSSGRCLQMKEKSIVEVCVISSVFLRVVFAWQVMAGGDQSASVRRRGV